MIEFTKEEISLCRQIAKKYRKDSNEWGEWICDEKDYKNKVVFVQRWIRIAGKSLIYEDSSGERADIKTTNWFPLWTISDCLEFLQEKEFNVIQLWKMERKRMWLCAFSSAIYSRRLEEREWKRGNTPLEACLKSVLTVLEERK